MNPVDALMILALRAGAEVGYVSDPDDGSRLTCSHPDRKVVEAFEALTQAIGSWHADSPREVCTDCGAES